MRALTFAVIALLAATARAELPQLQASVGYAGQYFSARQYDLLDVDDQLAMTRVAVGTGFSLPVGALDVDVAYSDGASQGAAHGTVPTAFWLRGLQLGATWRLPVRSWFQPYLQLSGGLDWATLTLFNEARLTQTVVSSSGMGLVGVQFSVRLGRRSEKRLPSLLFDLGGGGVLRTAARFDALAPTVDQPPADPIASGSVNLGTLPLSGYTLRALVGVRF